MSARDSTAQQGATTLLLALGLLVLGTLAAAWSSRAVLGDLINTTARSQALQARSAAQAALATAQAQLMTALEAVPAGDPFADPSQALPCPAGWPAPRWQCQRLPLPPATVPDGWRAEVWVARDLIASPHVWQVHAEARENAGRGQAFVRESLFAPVVAPAPALASPPALWLNGCFGTATGARWQICPLTTNGQVCQGVGTAPAVLSEWVPDGDGDGLLSTAERSACLAVPAISLPAGGAVLGPDAARARGACDRAVWRKLFGAITPAQLQAWSRAQQDNGLHSLSQPPRNVYWIDSPADWTQSLGSPEAPVLLVFSSLSCALRCPRIATGVQIHGTVYLDAGCDDDKLRGWQAGTIDGLLAIEGGLPAVGGDTRVRAHADARQAFALPWPTGLDARYTQRVSGSHREGPP